MSQELLYVAQSKTFDYWPQDTVSKFPEMRELSMRKQCVPGSFLSAHAQEPGNEAIHLRVAW